MSRYLLDTHTLLWWIFNDDRLSFTARVAIKNHENLLLLSTASAWEISTKHRIGKLPEAGSIVADLPRLLRQAKIQPLPISIDDALLAGSMKQKHRDPFDRMIIAQAQLRDISIITNDSAFGSFAANVLW